MSDITVGRWAPDTRRGRQTGVYVDYRFAPDDHDTSKFPWDDHRILSFDGISEGDVVLIVNRTNGGHVSSASIGIVKYFENHRSGRFMFCEVERFSSLMGFPEGYSSLRVVNGDTRAEYIRLMRIFGNKLTAKWREILESARPT